MRAEQAIPAASAPAALLRGILLTLVTASTGCGGLSTPTGDRCKRTTVLGSAPRVPPGPVHSDFGALRAYRHYFSLGGVEDYAHHFAVHYQCVEPSVSYFAVSDDGAVQETGRSWGGGLGIRPGERSQVPDHMQQQARLARAALTRKWEGESKVEEVYLGSFRKLVVNELIPMAPPGSPYERMVDQGEITLKADRGLSSLAPTPLSFTGGSTFLCWENNRVRDCGEQYWIDFELPTPTASRVTPAIADARSPMSNDERMRFTAAVLAAARAQQRGEPSISLVELLARDGDGLLPSGLATPITAEFRLYGRAKPDTPTQTSSGMLPVVVPIHDAVFGQPAVGTGSTTMAGVTLGGEVRAWAPEPLPRDAVGEHQVELRVAYSLNDGRGGERSAEFVVEASVLVDDGTVAVTALSPNDELWHDVHHAPRAQRLPGHGSFNHIDAVLWLRTTGPDWLGPGLP